MANGTWRDGNSEEVAETRDSVTEAVLMASRLLAAGLGVKASTVTRSSDRLVRKGLVRRRPSRRDRREVRLALTASGRALIEEATQARRRQLAGILAAVPLPEQQALIKALGHLNAAGGEVSDKDWALGWT